MKPELSRPTQSPATSTPLDRSLMQDEAQLVVELSRLNLLGNGAKGLVAYYNGLLQEDDDILGVAAACHLLDAKDFSPANFERIMALTKYNCVRQRAFDYLMDTREYTIAQQVVNTPGEPTSSLITDVMQATLNCDEAAMANGQIANYLHSADVGRLEVAALAFEHIGGWRMSVPMLIKIILAKPQDGKGVLKLIFTLARANRHDLLQQLRDIFRQTATFVKIVPLVEAHICQAEKKPAEALSWIDKVPTKDLAPEVLRSIYVFKADILDAMGKYPEAANFYTKQNDLAIKPNFDPKRFYVVAAEDEKLPKIDLPPDPNTNYFGMLGFPRSGTTLLENILQSHSEVETFEEIPSSSAVTRLMVVKEKMGYIWNDEVAMMARRAYYTEIERRRKKQSATVFVDKLPLLSYRAPMLEKLFPQKRYIFSIRHPYDVVLSCFRQNFAPNTAMDHLTSMERAFRLYDFTMTRWFDHFSLNSERVCYIRYDNLVLDARNEVSRALDFLGVTWQEGVLDFSSRADERRAQTPSYQKVRKGLTIGVQSSWRNYEFLFKKPEARLLDKWVQHFGYER